MEVRSCILAALFCVVAIQGEAYAQESDVDKILGRAGTDLQKNLKVLEDYYGKISEKSGGRKADADAELEDTVGTLPANSEASRQRKDQNSYALNSTVNRNRHNQLPRIARDPFAYTDRIVNSDPAFAVGGVGYTSKTLPVQGTLPKMQMRGFLEKGEDDRIALLEIEGTGVHMVREGDIVGLQAIGIDGVVRILELRALSLIVETGLSGRVVVVR